VVITLRGGSGAGKTTAVREILAIGAQETKLHGHTCYWVPSLNLTVLGSYKNVCGGCDTIQPYQDIIPMMHAAAKSGDVLMEGLMISANYGTIGKAGERYGQDFIFAFMDTPWEVCVTRVLQRRARRKNTKPFDPERHMRAKHNAVLRLQEKVLAGGYNVAEIDHKNAVEQLLELLYAN
jgi:adenylate kinase family enzyme